MTDVLILSRRGSGGVEHLAELVTGLGHRPVLVSERQPDLNAAHCAAHVVVDWTASVEEIVKHVVAQGIEPAGVLTMVDSFVGLQVNLARAHGFPAPSDRRAVLTNKAHVRAEIRALGVSDLEFVAGTAGTLPVAAVRRYPVIVKPAVESGASWLVARADDEDELRLRLHRMVEAQGDDFEVIVEDYLDGTEFSIDGPVLDGRFTPLFPAEKAGHDEHRHHDAGLLINPPQSASVCDAVEATVKVINALAAELRLHRMWLHVEGRALNSGGSELVEINTRPGGGVYRAAVLHACGIDPFWECVQMTLDQKYVPDFRTIPRGDELFAILPLSVHQAGWMHTTTDPASWRSIEGVVTGYAHQDLEVTDLERENFYAQLVLTAADVPSLHRIADQVRSVLHCSISEDK